MEEIEHLPPIGEIVRIHSPYSEFHGLIGFVTDYVEGSNLILLAAHVHISGREDIIVEIDCLRWQKKKRVT
jgi:hypothetical protein